MAMIRLPPGPSLPPSQAPSRRPRRPSGWARPQLPVGPPAPPLAGRAARPAPALRVLTGRPPSGLCCHCRPQSVMISSSAFKSSMHAPRTPLPPPSLSPSRAIATTIHLTGRLWRPGQPPCPPRALPGPGTGRPFNLNSSWHPSLDPFKFRVRVY